MHVISFTCTHLHSLAFFSHTLFPLTSTHLISFTTSPVISPLYPSPSPPSPPFPLHPSLTLPRHPHFPVNSLTLISPFSHTLTQTSFKSTLISLKFLYYTYLILSSHHPIIILSNIQYHTIQYHAIQYPISNIQSYPILQYTNCNTPTKIQEQTIQRYYKAAIPFFLHFTRSRSFDCSFIRSLVRFRFTPLHSAAHH